MKDKLTKGRASKRNLENMAAKLRIEKEQKLHGGASAQELLNAQYPTPAKDNINLNDYFSESENVPQGYYDDGKGNIVFAPNVKNLKDLDDLGIKGAYIGEVFYDEDSATYYDENGVVHYNMVLDWGNMEYEWNFSKWLSNLDFEGDTVDKIGSGFVLVGHGSQTKVSNISENPSEDIYVDRKILTAASSFAKSGSTSRSKGRGYGPNKGVGKKRESIISNFKGGMDKATKIKKKIEAVGKGLDLFTSNGSVNADTENNLKAPKVNTVTVKIPGENTTKTSIIKVSEIQSLKDSIREVKKGKIVKINRPK